MNGPSPASRLPAPRRLLIRGVNWLGDAVMTTPALMRLRQALPHTHITLLTPAKLADLWRHYPALDACLAFAPNESLFSVARRLRQLNCNAALALPNSPRSALELWLARIPVRAGLARPWRNLFLTHPLPAPAFLRSMHKRSTGEVRALAAEKIIAQQPAYALENHHVHHYLHLAAAWGADPTPVAPMLAVTPEEATAWRALFGVEDRLILGLCPGAEYGPAKRWPLERFQAAALALHQRTDCLWLILGGQADRKLAEILVRGLPAPACLDLTGKTSLRELCAALKACRLLLTNDTGPMHLAAAVGTPVVALFGSTSPELTGPGLPGDKHHRLLRGAAPCAPCFRRDCPLDLRCLNNISAAQVIEAVLEVLSSTIR